MTTNLPTVAATSACQDCDAPIALPARGRRKVFCAACSARRGAQRSAEWRATLSPEEREVRVQYHRDYQLRKKYGIASADFDALLAAQVGRCKICGTDEPNGKDWHVDHNHVTGQVRGILCHGCNIGIGHLKDDPARLRAAAAYLERT